jgi:hypothetical protein
MYQSDQKFWKKSPINVQKSPQWSLVKYWFLPKEIIDPKLVISQQKVAQSPKSRAVYFAQNGHPGDS